MRRTSQTVTFCETLVTDHSFAPGGSAHPSSSHAFLNLKLVPFTGRASPTESAWSQGGQSHSSLRSDISGMTSKTRGSRHAVFASGRDGSGAYEA